MSWPKNLRRRERILYVAGGLLLGITPWLLSLGVEWRAILGIASLVVMAEGWAGF